MSEGRMEAGGSLRQIEDQVQCLGYDYAIERVLRQHTGLSQVPHESSLWASGIEMQDVLPRDLRAAEAGAVPVIRNLQHAASYVSRTGLKEVFDVVAID
ncbi:MAG: hypothetical protein ABSC65_30135, partial [Acidobacteriaceae bacterium]